MRKPIRFDIPTPFIHGGDGQIVPIGASAPMAAQLVRGSTPKVHAGSPHGIDERKAARFKTDPLAFLTGAQALAA